SPDSLLRLEPLAAAAFAGRRPEWHSIVFVSWRPICPFAIIATGSFDKIAQHAPLTEAPSAGPSICCPLTAGDRRQDRMAVWIDLRCRQSRAGGLFPRLGSEPESDVAGAAGVDRLRGGHLCDRYLRKVHDGQELRQRSLLLRQSSAHDMDRAAVLRAPE